LTNLNLKIVGLVAASIPHYSSTIIDDAGQQTSYFVGSKIKGTSATISSIFRDRIILNVNGNMQALLFDKNAANKHVVADQKPQRTVKINRQAILKNPQKLNDYIKISVVAKNGKIIGYRVNPGHDKSVFESAGLVPGDIAVRINGVDLTNQQQSLTLLRSFPTLHKMSLTVNRKGKFYHLNLHLP
jgi:general secretion pathway protein C